MSDNAWRRGCAALVCYFASITAALAQGVFYTPDQQPAAWNVSQKPTEWDVNLAIGAAMLPTFNGSDRYRATPIPLLIVRWRDAISLGADGLNLYWHDDNLRIGGGVSYDGGRLDHETSGILNSGDNRLQGLGDIDASLGARAFVSYKWGPAYLDIAATKFIGPQNKGVVVSLAAAAPLSLTKDLVIRPHIGTTWADDNYMQTFFGVTAVQSTASIFPQYSAGAGLENVNGGLTVVYLLSQHWFVGADASATQYLDDAAKSPITISNTNATVGAVVGYHF
jgi:outer membrane scaffolding protein for murein synthesis (MipA/OmpV family)